MNLSYWRHPSYRKAKYRWWAILALRAILEPFHRLYLLLYVMYVAGTTPIFVATPKSPAVRISTANTNRDGSTGTYGTVFTAGSNGSFFPGARVTAEGNTTAGAVRFFVQDGGSGNLEMKKEIIVPAVTFAAGTTPVFEAEWYPPAGIMLSASSVVKASTHIGETFAASLEGGGDY